MSERAPRPVQIDVGQIVRRSVATLYSHLVTRPTGRAVRLAIESQLNEAVGGAGAGDTTFSLIDMSEVTILDFSCADEVVAKLLLRTLGQDRPWDAFFVFRGVGDLHRASMEAVLERQGLAAVAQSETGVFELLGDLSREEEEAWIRVEEWGRVPHGRVDTLFPRTDHRSALDRLVGRRLVYQGGSQDIHALSRLVGDLV